jgi:hypothetical protein
MEPRTAGKEILRDQGAAGACTRMVTHLEALLTRVPRDDAEIGGRVVG